MSEANDDVQNVALAAVAGVVALVVAGVIALAVAVPGGQVAPVAVEAPAAQGSVEPVYFEPGSAALTAEAQAVLAQVADIARANAGATVLISGVHAAAAAGDPTRETELTGQRAEAVRHALEANGVPPGSLVLDRPAVVQGGPDSREARRVDVRVR